MITSPAMAEAIPTIRMRSLGVWAASYIARRTPSGVPMEGAGTFDRTHPEVGLRVGFARPEGALEPYVQTVYGVTTEAGSGERGDGERGDGGSNVTVGLHVRVGRRMRAARGGTP